MIALDECVSPHVAMLQRVHVRLVWQRPYPSLERARPVAWTCWCRATVYELCAGGGRAFLRRTVQLDRGPDIHETSLMPLSEARATWTALLSGSAR
ncbi:MULTISPECIES: hypothetical protein [Streptosporangium]|uniref:Uncharacterized protein n=1 Tax=Streptosporangium brasiliense TaxID=47480 RepID=A0ABT9R6M6_9ACTN|nr:hypothetical protein [Streptosporangium brasiliense]MDP9864899.1 hypothetical protein [Streptosporangium brasiliense]